MKRRNNIVALNTVPTIMRLSILALFIALPTTAYAAVFPQGPQLGSRDIKVQCAELAQWCNDNVPCCGRLQCTWNGFSSVCLTFAPIHIGSDLRAGMRLRHRSLSQAGRGSKRKVQVTVVPCSYAFSYRACCTHLMDKWSWSCIFALSPLQCINKPWIMGMLS